jgi:hypothetical protein
MLFSLSSREKKEKGGTYTRGSGHSVSLTRSPKLVTPLSKTQAFVVPVSTMARMVRKPTKYLYDFFSRSLDPKR